MKEPYTICAGCGKGFYLNEKNIHASSTIGCSDFQTICHKNCCGKYDSCVGCGVYIQKKVIMKKVAVKSIFNIVSVAIQTLSDIQLSTVEGVELNLSPLVAAEQDKRAGIISDYIITFTENNKAHMQLVLGEN